MELWTVLLAAGQSTRLQEIGSKKQFHSWNERPLYWHSCLSLRRIPAINGLVFVLPGEALEERSEEIRKLWSEDHLGLTYRLAAGGSERQDSVRAGLDALPPSCSHVLIHDAARPFASPELILSVVEALSQGHVAVVPGMAVRDTIKQVRRDRVNTLDRKELVAVQTPQGFALPTLRRAHEKAKAEAWSGTDDASLVERMSQTVHIIPGQEDNVKITSPGDLRLLEPRNRPLPRPCIGWGYDVHRFGPGRPLKLGGIEISNAPQVMAHSDGDVLMHALIDALLGCLGRGDIGELFPDTDPGLENVNSAILLAEVQHRIQQAGLVIDHVDLTLICQTPKLAPWKDQIKKNLAGLLGLKPDHIGLKATTEEGLGFTGEKKGIKAVALIIGHSAQYA